MIETLKNEMNYQGVSVIIPRRQCIQTLRDKDLGQKIRELGLK